MSNERSSLASASQTFALDDGTGRLTRRAWAALLVLCGALFLDTLDISMTGVALPSIRSDLDVSTSSLQWVLSAYVRLPAAGRARRGPGSAGGGCFGPRSASSWRGRLLARARSSGLVNTSFQFGGALVLAVATAVHGMSGGTAATPQALFDAFQKWMRHSARPDRSPRPHRRWPVEVDT